MVWSLEIDRSSFVCSKGHGKVKIDPFNFTILKVLLQPEKGPSDATKIILLDLYNTLIPIESGSLISLVISNESTVFFVIINQFNLWNTQIGLLFYVYTYVLTKLNYKLV